MKTAKEVTEHLLALKNEVERERQNSLAPGNPYIVGLQAKIHGIECVLSTDIYKAAPQMLEALETIQAALAEGKIIGDPKTILDGKMHEFVSTLNKVNQAIFKARGEK